MFKGWPIVTNSVEQFRMGAWARGAVVFSLFVLTSSAHVFGPWVTYPTPNVPRLADGRPDLNAPAPRQPDGMMNRADVIGVRAYELVGDLGGRVGAAVVDDEDLEVRRQLRRGFDGTDHHARDGAAVVVRRKEDTQTRGLSRGRS